MTGETICGRRFNLRYQNKFSAVDNHYIQKNDVFF